jgi:hypothetical protein
MHAGVGNSPVYDFRKFPAPLIGNLSPSYSGLDAIPRFTGDLAGVTLNAAVCPDIDAVLS